MPYGSATCLTKGQTVRAIESVLSNVFSESDMIALVLAAGDRDMEALMTEMRWKELALTGCSTSRRFVGAFDEQFVNKLRR